MHKLVQKGKVTQSSSSVHSNSPFHCLYLPNMNIIFVVLLVYLFSSGLTAFAYIGRPMHRIASIVLVSQIQHIYIYIYTYYGDVIHQRRRRVYIYAYTPARRLICIIYTSYVLCSPEERFNSTNNESISSDRYRRTKFSAKIIFHMVHQCSPQYLYPS